MDLNMEEYQNQLEFFEIISDPVKFAKFHFNWTAYPYQEKILQNNSLRQVLRLARRMGKTDTLAIKAIHYSYCNGKDPDDPDSRASVVLIAAPYENQVKLIFSRIVELINNSPDLKQGLAKYKQNPETLIWKNGAKIIGLTAGTKAGAGGASIRGQRADWIIVDEIDYMTEADIISIFAIASDPNTGDPGIIISSTPTGRRSKFWELCVAAQGGVASVPPGMYVEPVKNPLEKPWTTFYYPYSEHPKRQTVEERAAYEREWKRTLGDMGFIHECLAEFGEETVGVFRKEYIDRAKKEYDYLTKPKKQHDNVRVMGVDWDKIQATPTFCMLEYSPDEENSFGEKCMLKVINRMSMPRTEFTLMHAVDELVKWNNMYQPNYIYVDRGYGEYQVEALHAMGKEAIKDGPKNPAWMLNERIVGVHFSEKRDVRDPGTSEIVKKDVKPWMVNQTVILMERDRLRINENDDELWKQMENYRVEKIGVDGRPTYTSVNEHSVDALTLCVLAITDKFPEITKLVKKFEPARTMAIAPPLQTPTMDIVRGAHKDKDEEEEFFLTKKIKSQNSETWFKVDDLRASVARSADRTMVNMFRNSPFAPRGSGKARPFNRKGF
jgi:replicative DNA helicase